MPILTTVVALALYAAAALLVAGLARKIVQYARTPAPLKIPTTPAPVTRTGVAGRLVREVVLFESLFKASKWTWLFGWVFHAALLVVLVGHLRYFTEPVWMAAASVTPRARRLSTWSRISATSGEITTVSAPVLS